LAFRFAPGQPLKRAVKRKGSSNMTIDQFIALSASVGAFMSAIGTFLTVRQMSQQRKASYLPELVLSRTSFEGSRDLITYGPMPTRWVSISDTEKKKEISPWFSMPLSNVGLGAAKSISVSWSFPIQEMVSQVNDLAQRTLTPAYFTLKDGAVSIELDNLRAGTSFWANQQQETLDYVLPAAIQKEPVPLKLPPAFILLSSALVFVSAKEEGRESIAKISPLVVSLEYCDIGNNTHAAIFEINLHIVAYAGEGTSIHGYLESKKVSLISQ
jgi:hypothetical protein